MELKSLDFYCERTGPEFWSEPWNAWSNLSFILAGLWALWAWTQIRKQNPAYARRRPLILGGLLVLVGIGSFLFHTYANNLTYIGDLVPIFIFTSVYLYHSARRFLSHSALTSSLLLFGCVAAMLIMELKVPKTILNGSLLYVPPLMLMFYFALSMRKLPQKNWSRTYLIASFIFLVSLTARTLDPNICDSFPLGTHFIWHTLNGFFLGLLMSIALGFDRTNPLMPFG